MDWVEALHAIVEFVLNNYQMRIFGILLGVNIGFGMLAAIYTGQFKLWKLADFLKRMLCYGGAYSLVKVAAMAETSFDKVATAVWAFIVATMVGHILANLKELGLPIEGTVARAVAKDT